MTNLKDFKSKKAGLKLNETVTLNGNDFIVRNSITVPSSLVSAYMKKVKDESGQDLLNTHSKDQIAELLVQYLSETFMNIENFPTSIVLGTAATQVQPQVQPQGQIQDAQPQSQIQDADAQDIQAQATAQDIQAQEGGQSQLQPQGQTQGQGQGQIQGQGQPQGQGQGQEIQGGQTQSI